MTDKERQAILEEMRLLLRQQQRLMERYVELERQLRQDSWEKE